MVFWPDFWTIKSEYIVWLDLMHAPPSRLVCSSWLVWEPCDSRAVGSNVTPGMKLCAQKPPKCVFVHWLSSSGLYEGSDFWNYVASLLEDVVRCWNRVCCECFRKEPCFSTSPCKVLLRWSVVSTFWSWCFIRVITADMNITVTLTKASFF